MRIHWLLALLWCAPAGAASLADLASQLEFSGSSARTSDLANAQLNMVGKDLILSSHDLMLNFHDSVSRRKGGEYQSLRVRYAFPVAGGNVSVALEDSDHAGVARAGDQRFDAQAEYHALTFSGSRALWSWRGLELDSLFSHATDSRSRFEESEWVADSTHRLSRVGLRCSGHRELSGGFTAGSTLTAIGGWETRESVSMEDSSSSGSRYHKLALAASLSRTFHTWNIAVDGRYQLAPADLSPSEYMQVAGPSLLRGFNGQSKYVSEGGWFRVNALSPGYSVPFLDAFNSYFSLAVLRGWSSESVAGEDSFRASTGEISLRLQGQGFSANMSVGQILDLTGREIQIPASPDVSLTMSVKI